MLTLVAVGCTTPPARPPAAEAPAADARQGCRREAIDQAVAPRVSELRHAIAAGDYPRPGGDRGLQAQIDRLDQMAAGCTRGNADDCQGLAVEGQSRELFVCAVHGWQTECDAANARSCLQLGDVYSTTYYMPSLRPFAADPRRASDLYARGTALYQQACDRGDTATCHDMAFQPAILSHDPARGRAILLKLCDRGEGVSCAEAGSYVVGDPAERPKLWERGCYAPRPWGLACKMLADLPESAQRKAELEQRACQLDPRTCPHPVVQPPP